MLKSWETIYVLSGMTSYVRIVCDWSDDACVLIVFFFLMIRRPPRSTQSRSSAASDVYKRQALAAVDVATDRLLQEARLVA